MMILSIRSNLDTVYQLFVEKFDLARMFQRCNVVEYGLDVTGFTAEVIR